MGAGETHFEFTEQQTSLDLPGSNLIFQDKTASVTAALEANSVAAVAFSVSIARHACAGSVAPVALFAHRVGSATRWVTVLTGACAVAFRTVTDVAHLVLLLDFLDLQLFVDRVTLQLNSIAYRLAVFGHRKIDGHHLTAICIQYLSLGHLTV